MSKEPAERYQELCRAPRRPDALDRPARVRAILGAEADAARSFHPPPPVFDEEDLRLLGTELTTSPDGFSLRDLGTAEPSTAPRHQHPLPPLPVKIRSAAVPDPVTPRLRPHENSDLRWLVHFAIIALVAGLVAILFITMFYRF